MWHRYSWLCLLSSRFPSGTGKSASTPADENRFCWGPLCLCYTNQMLFRPTRDELISSRRPGVEESKDRRFEASKTRRVDDLKT